MTSDELLQNEELVLEVFDSLENLKSDDARFIEFKKYYSSILKGSIFTIALMSLKENPPTSNDKSLFKEFVGKLISEGAYENSGSTYTSITCRLRDENLRTIIDEIYNQRHWNQ